MVPGSSWPHPVYIILYMASSRHASFESLIVRAILARHPRSLVYFQHKFLIHRGFNQHHSQPVPTLVPVAVSYLLSQSCWPKTYTCFCTPSPPVNILHHAWRQGTNDFPKFNDALSTINTPQTHICPTTSSTSTYALSGRASSCWGFNWTPRIPTPLPHWYRPELPDSNQGSKMMEASGKLLRACGR